jgi:serine protease Do
LGTDPSIDIAVVEIDTNDNLVLGKLGDSGTIQVGDFVIAAGNPFGLSGTITLGIISALGRRNLQTENVSLTDFIQTDAAINPGNSGGPLINIKGEVIGINTLIYSQSGGNEGVGFAIPINTAKNVAYKIIDKGKVEHGYLGIYYRELTADDIKQLGLKNIDAGMLITNVVKASPAEKSGLSAGDVIIKVDNQKITNSNDLAVIIGNKDPGTKVVFTILRDNKTTDKEVTLSARPGKETAENKNTNNYQNEQQVVIDKYGMAVTNINSDIRQKYKLSNDDKGVLITGVAANSPAGGNGLQAGDIIYKINNTTINSSDEVVKISKEDRENNYFFIKRNGRTFIVIM